MKPYDCLMKPTPKRCPRPTKLDSISIQHADIGSGPRTYTNILGTLMDYRTTSVTFSENRASHFQVHRRTTGLLLLLFRKIGPANFRYTDGLLYYFYFFFGKASMPVVGTLSPQRYCQKNFSALRAFLKRHIASRSLMKPYEALWSSVELRDAS